MNFYDFEAVLLTGEQVAMSDYRGHVVLVVNTASKCGFTPQYEGLEKLYQKHKDQGLVVLGFPCNQFGGQEPGSADDIQAFCQINYGVTFPMFAKIKVNGPDTHPLFKYLKKQQGGFLGSRIKWNFTKFLIDRHGQPVARYGSSKKPEKIGRRVEALLKD